MGIPLGGLSQNHTIMASTMSGHAIGTVIQGSEDPVESLSDAFNPGSFAQPYSSVYYHQGVSLDQSISIPTNYTFSYGAIHHPTTYPGAIAATSPVLPLMNPTELRPARMVPQATTPFRHNSTIPLECCTHLEKLKRTIDILFLAFVGSRNPGLIRELELVALLKAVAPDSVSLLRVGFEVAKAILVGRWPESAGTLFCLFCTSFACRITSSCNGINEVSRSLRAESGQWESVLQIDLEKQKFERMVQSVFLRMRLRKGHSSYAIPMSQRTTQSQQSSTIHAMNELLSASCGNDKGRFSMSVVGNCVRLLEGT